VISSVHDAIEGGPMQFNDLYNGMNQETLENIQVLECIHRGFQDTDMIAHLEISFKMGCVTMLLD
jgi:hypothetical protein